jgi:hypothetical protein
MVTKPGEADIGKEVDAQAAEGNETEENDGQVEH